MMQGPNQQGTFQREESKKLVHPANSNDVWGVDCELPQADHLHLNVDSTAPSGARPHPPSATPLGAFDESIFRYLEGPIEFKDRGDRPLYVYVLSFDAPTEGAEQFLRFNFRVRTIPDPSYVGPRQPEVDAGRRRAEHGTVFSYVFSSLLTLDSNRANLRDFVLGQCGQADSGTGSPT